MVYALRDDLNIIEENRYTSEPFVLVSYQEKDSSKYRMSIYKVLLKDSSTTDTIELNGEFKNFNYDFVYDIYAGDKVVAPYPLNIVIGANSVQENFAENRNSQIVYWEDKDGNSWSVSGDGSFSAKFWYPMRDDFWHPNSDIKTGDIIPWSKDSKVDGNYFVSNGENYLDFNNEIEVTYNSKWNDKEIAKIRLGESVTFAGGEEKKDNTDAKGLPSVVAWASAEVVFDEINPNGDSTGLRELYTVKIKPVLREIKVDLKNIDFPKELLPASKLTTNIGGKLFFENLDAGLKQRIYYEQSLGKVVLRGILNDKLAGDPKLTADPGGYDYILQPNILTIDELNRLKSLSGANDNLKNAFEKLYILSQNPTLSESELNSASIEDVKYRVGLSRFLRDKNNRLLVIDELDINKLKYQLPNSQLPQGINISDLELKDKSELPINFSLDTETEKALSNLDNRLVRIKNDKYIQDSQLGVGFAIFTNPNLLKPSSFNSSYVVIAENNDPRLKNSPVALHILKVVNRPYRGQIKTLFSDNVFDEKITIRHTGDFGANVKNLIFDWRYKETDGVETPPITYQDPSCSIENVLQVEELSNSNWNPFNDDRENLPDNYEENQGRYELVFGKNSGKDLLVDNSFYVRYRHKDCIPDATDTRCWSGWAGSAGNNPCNTPDPIYKSQLVKGWVKRVTDKVNVYDARINDFSQDAPATYVSMIEQVGLPYDGDVALNPDKNIIENVGLAALYQTVLERAKDLSIDASQANSTDGVTQALQNAATSTTPNKYKIIMN